MKTDLRSQSPVLHDCPIVRRLPIQWGDLDAYRHVNNVVYLQWFATVRAVYAARVGVETHASHQGIGAVLASISAKFHRPLSFPGDILAGVRRDRMTLGTLRLACHIADAATGVPAADCLCDVVLYDNAEGKPIPIPEHVRAAIEALEQKPYPA